MRGPYTFEEKDPDDEYKYAVGDWIKSDDSICAFWKISKQLKLDGLLAYDVMFMSGDLSKRGLRHIGDFSAVWEHDVRPLTDQRDILLCRASDLKLQEYELLKRAKQLGSDCDALMRSRELIK
jgi:hypothetical protein